MYKVTRIVKTYACRKAISNSRNMIPVTITHGKAASSASEAPEVSKAQEKPIRIFSKAWPDIMLAKSRILRLKTRAM